MKDYPDAGKILQFFKTHDFDVLKFLAGLSEEITATKNETLFYNWSIATAWKPEQRYLPKGTSDKKKAQAVLSSIRDDPDGLLTWLSKRW